MGPPEHPRRRDPGHAGLSGILLDPGDRDWWHWVSRARLVLISRYYYYYYIDAQATQGAE